MSETTSRHTSRTSSRSSTSARASKRSCSPTRRASSRRTPDPSCLADPTRNGSVRVGLLTSIPRSATLRLTCVDRRHRRSSRGGGDARPARTSAAARAAGDPHARPAAPGVRELDPAGAGDRSGLRSARPSSGSGSAPVMFELGARPHPPRELYRAYLAAERRLRRHLRRELRLGRRPARTSPASRTSTTSPARSMPKLIYIKASRPPRRARSTSCIDRIRADDTPPTCPSTPPTSSASGSPNDLADPARRALRRSQRPSSRTRRRRRSADPPAAFAVTTHDRPRGRRRRRVRELLARWRCPRRDA